MLSHPYETFTPSQQGQSSNNNYLSSSSLPIPTGGNNNNSNHNAELLTSAYDPHLFDDLYYLDNTVDPLSSSLPDDWFTFSQNDDFGITMDSSFYQPNMPTIDETALSSMPPPPALSQSFSPQSEMSMTSPQQQPQQQQHQQHQQHFNNNSNNIMPSVYKGHRRRRSSSLPSIFYSAKKQMVQPSFMPPLFDTTPSATNSHHDSPVIMPSTLHNAAHQASVNMFNPPPSLPEPPTAAASAASSLAYGGKPMPIQIQRQPQHHRYALPLALDQQQLDDKLRRVNFDDVTVAELKDLLRERNLSVAGRKAELSDRLYKERQKLDSQQKTPMAKPPSASTSLSTSPSPSSSSSRVSPPPPIQQLTHQLGDLGFQHPQRTPSQQSTTIPVSLPSIHPTQPLDTISHSSRVPPRSSQQSS